MNHDNNMEGDVTKLLALLKKILKNYPQGSDQIAKFMDQKSFNLNLCFLTFVPMSPEDLMEFEEMYEEYFNRSDEQQQTIELLIYTAELEKNWEALHQYLLLAKTLNPHNPKVDESIKMVDEKLRKNPSTP